MNEVYEIFCCVFVATLYGFSQHSSWSIVCGHKGLFMRYATNDSVQDFISDLTNRMWMGRLE